MTAPPERRRDRGRRRTARGAAYDLLHAVHVDGAYANLTLPGILDRAGLSPRDAALATELAYGTLRWQGLYDAVLGTCVDRPLDDVDGRLLDVLRLGCHQILGLRTPPHAAVSETVTLARSVAGEGPARFVNAVLRRVVDGGDRDAWTDRVATGTATERLAVATSHPEWIVRALGQALATHSGTADPEELRRALDADNEPAAPVLVARDLAIDELLSLPQVTPGRWSPRAAVLVEGRPEQLSCVRDGSVGVQDEGSQLVALALAQAPLEGRDELWVDLAAGPGGKAALLARLAAHRDGRLIAVEQHGHRAELVRRSLPSGAHEVITGDGRTCVPAESADRVLVDAPCTGLGALRRRPEARWRRSPSDLATLGPLQRELLLAGIDAVRPGGLVLYATCSPHVAETDLVVSDVLRRRDDVEQLDVRPYLPGVPDLGPGPSARLWPHLHGTDGMFLALLRRQMP